VVASVDPAQAQSPVPRVSELPATEDDDDRSTYRITVDLPADLYDSLRTWAFTARVPASRIVRSLLAEAFADEELAHRVRERARSKRRPSTD
jgi:hypothetical protein